MCRWEKHLPAEVREAGNAGNPCCLFWPPAAVAMHNGDSTAEGMWARLRQQSFVQALMLAIQVCAALSLLFVPHVTHAYMDVHHAPDLAKLDCHCFTHAASKVESQEQHQQSSACHRLA